MQPRQTGFHFEAHAEGNTKERAEWWLLRVPFQPGKNARQPCAAPAPCAARSPNGREHLPRLPWQAAEPGWLPAGDKAPSLPGSPGCEGTAEPAGGRRGEHRGEQEEEQNSSCTRSHKSSLLNSLGNSHSTKFRGSLHGAKLAPAGEERKLLGKNN